MIWTRTPLRVTLGGGGTDLQSYYQNDGGFIFAMGLDKYIYIAAHRPAFTTDVTLYGLEPEVSPTADAVKHDLVRAALMSHGFEDRFETASIADITGGTGMGSSSCFLVGFLRALYALKGETPDRQALAEEACDLEINVLGRGIGKQDQYMAAFGGLTTLDIAKDGQVEVGSLDIAPDVEAAFVAHTHIYYTGLRRDASVILDDQNSAMLEIAGARHDRVSDSLTSIKELGYRILQAWQEGDLETWGKLLHEHWISKKQLSAKISWPHIDNLYDHVRANFGVTGGKVIGAGGGGFLMLFTPHDGDALESFMTTQNMPRLRYGIDRAGTHLVAS
jgi:D-glycero-alpha-D-manno-heptose-7-phosphate kinase